VAYSPTLAVGEAYSQLSVGRTDLLSRSLVEQVAPPGMIEATRRAFSAKPEGGSYSVNLQLARENLRCSYEAGVLLVAGSGSGSPMLLHGPAIHRELQLWVEAGVPPAEALKAATHNAARLLRAGERIGMVKAGYEANLLLVDGNPLEDIAATERISTVFFQGERLNRAALLEGR
jgi:adenine deaminase